MSKLMYNGQEYSSGVNYASVLPMSPSDSTKVNAAINSKANTSDVVLKTDLIIAKDLTIPANTSIADAISSIITTYGRNPVMFSFVITGDNYYEGFINFYSNFVGGGYIVKTSTVQNVFYSLSYANGSVYVSEKANAADFDTTQVYEPTLSNVSTSTSANEKIWYWKSGKVVTVAVDLIVAETSKTLVVCNIPAGFRPPTNITTTAVSYGSASNVARYCTIYANGNIIFYSADSARLLFNVTYVTA